MRVTGFHFIFTAYGFWLPNDPRGSWSDTIRQFDLLAAGPPNKTDATRSSADVPHDVDQRLAAKSLLKHPPVRLSGQQAREVARGIAEASREGDYRVHALTILPDHVHLVMAWHARSIDQIAAHIKAKMTRRLSEAGMHPMASCGARERKARNFWCPYIRDEEHMRRAIEYVELNAVRAGMKRQAWHLVVPFEG